MPVSREGKSNHSRARRTRYFRPYFRDAQAPGSRKGGSVPTVVAARQEARAPADSASPCSSPGAHPGRGGVEIDRDRSGSGPSWGARGLCPVRGERRTKCAGRAPGRSRASYSTAGRRAPGSVTPRGARSDGGGRRPRAVPRPCPWPAVGQLSIPARPCRGTDASGTGDSRRSRISKCDAGGARRGR